MTIPEASREGGVGGIDLIAHPESFPARRRLADCVILASDGRLLLQRHPDGCPRRPGAVHPFGGHVEDGETPLRAMVREVREETGGVVCAEDAVFLGAMTEAETGHRDLVHVWFWRDAAGTVTGCHEREEIRFDAVGDALAHPGLMPYARLSLLLAVGAGLLPRPDGGHAESPFAARPVGVA